jgi:hypothetical protein
MFVTGMLLVTSEAVRLYTSLFFRTKLVLLIVAGVNMLVFHRTTSTPPRAKLAGALSLTCWIGIIAMGRAIGVSQPSVFDQDGAAVPSRHFSLHYSPSRDGGISLLLWIATASAAKWVEFA